MSNKLHFIFISTLTCIFTLLGCNSEDQSPEASKPETTSEVPSGPVDNTGGNAPTAGHGGKIIHLGNTTIGSFQVMATRDVGLIVAGKDAPIDVTLTPVPGSTISASAVRFWIGTKDAVGSMKAKSEIENPAEPNRWHTHADVPNPIPAGSMLWVEIESDTGEKVTCSFDLKS